MRKFEVILTFKQRTDNSLPESDDLSKRQKIIDVELDDADCLSPELFCDNVINRGDRNDIVRINIVENRDAKSNPLNWLYEHRGRLYVSHGVPIIFNRN
jgi:hypothetical protein